MKKLYLLISFIAIAAVASAQCSVTASVLSDVVCRGQCNGIAHAATGGGGTPPYTYSWSPAGGTGSTGTGLCAGIYTVVLTDALGCTATDTVLVHQPTPLLVNISEVNAASCFNGNNGRLTSTPSGSNGAPYGYVWSPIGGNGATASGLQAGDNYTVTVTDSKGCTAVDTMTVSQPPNSVLASVTSTGSVSCYGQGDGSVILNVYNGTPPYTYNFTPFVGNTYTVTGQPGGPWTGNVYDANGCAAYPAPVTTIPEPNPLDAQTQLAGNSCGSGCASVTAWDGTFPYSYLWSPTGGTGQTACGLTTGNYTVTVTDAHGCTVSRTIAITQPASMTATGSTITNDPCWYSNQGSAAASVSGGSGPFTYLWTPSNQTTATAVSLTPGNYNVLVTDHNGCTATSAAVVTSPPSINPHLTLVSEVSCNGGFNGCLSVAPTGGTPGYTYDWSTTFPACGLPAGTYTVTVTDQNGCSTTSSATVTQPAALTTYVTTTTSSCGTCTNGTATAHPSGGTGAYTYFWNTTPTQTTQTAVGLTPGVYTCCVTDHNGCQTCASSSVILSVEEIEAGLNFFTVYPNPFHSSATVIINSDKVLKAELMIFDMLGNEVRKSEIVDQKSEISNLSPGVYLLTIRDEASGRMAHSRLIVQ